MKTKPDETLEEIWAIRRQIAKKFNFDPKKQVAYYQRKQKQLGATIYQPSAPAAADALHDHADAQIVPGKSATPTSYSANCKPKAKRAK